MRAQREVTRDEENRARNHSGVIAEEQTPKRGNRCDQKNEWPHRERFRELAAKAPPCSKPWWYHEPAQSSTSPTPAVLMHRRHMRSTAERRAFGALPRSKRVATDCSISMNA